MSTSNERVSPDKQEDVPVVRHVSEVHIPSTSATRSTSANISHDESDVLSSYIRNARGDVQSTIFTAYTLSRQAATRANEVAVAAYGKDLDGAEQKIAELQAASEAAMEAILRAAAQLDVVVPTSSGGVQDDEKDIGNAADLREGVGRDTRNEKAGNNEPEAMVPPDIADEQNRRKLIADAKRREKEAIAQAEAELEELGMDAKKSTSRTRFKENSTTRKMKQLTVTTERNIPSNKSDEWENMTTKKAYIENWLQDPLFPMGSTPRTPPPPIDILGAESTPTPAATQSRRGKEKVGSIEVVRSKVPTLATVTTAQKDTNFADHHQK